MDNLLKGLVKKDPDLQVIEHSEDHLVIESALMETPPVGTMAAEPVEVPLLAHETKGPLVQIPVQIVRIIHIVNALYTVLMTCWGLLIALAFEYDVSRIGLIVGFSMFTTLSMIAYVVMYFIRDPFYCVPAIALWMFLLFMALNTLSALMHNMAVFQAIAIILCQSLSILVYCAQSPRGLKLLWAFGIMCGAGMIPWLLGLYAFIKNNDWITAVVLFFGGVIGSAAYATYQIQGVHRFNTSRGDLVRAVVHNYTDIAFGPIRWIAKEIQKRQSLLEEEVLSPPLPLQ